MDHILEAIQAREALLNDGECSGCMSLARRWRCKECTDPGLLCRKCIWRSHISNPLHRIEHWMGTYFRRAVLWEVGVYISLRHWKDSSPCANIQWQNNILESFQKRKDEEDQQSRWDSGEAIGPTMPEPDSDRDFVDDPDRDAATFRVLDQLLNGQDPEAVLEEDDEELGEGVQTDLLDADAGPGFATYINHNQIGVAGTTPAAPH